MNNETPIPKPPTIAFADTLSPFQYFCNRVLPAVYGDEISYYEVLCKVTKYLNETMKNVNVVNDELKETYEYVKQLYEVFDDYVQHGFEEYYADQVIDWIDSHLTWIFNHIAKQVFFGLTLDGHFCAYIPDSWSDITFDTGAVYGRTDYGCLILRFTSDGAVDNTYSYSLAQSKPLEKLIADLEVTAKRGDASFDTLFTNLDQEVIINADI